MYLKYLPIRNEILLFQKYFLTYKPYFLFYLFPKPIKIIPNITSKEPIKDIMLKFSLKTKCPTSKTITWTIPLTTGTIKDTSYFTTNFCHKKKLIT